MDIKRNPKNGQRTRGAMTARFYGIPVSALLSALLLGAVLTLASQTAPASNEESGKEACLKCHGPFSKLAEKTRGYKAPSGETTTPHRHVPHDSKEEKTIPECEQCHQKHPVPPTAEDLAALKNKKPSLDVCYKCHHIEDFTSCKTCHQG
jgi:hypothetical protein